MGSINSRLSSSNSIASSISSNSSFSTGTNKRLSINVNCQASINPTVKPSGGGDGGDTVGRRPPTISLLNTTNRPQTHRTNTVRGRTGADSDRSRPPISGPSTASRYKTRPTNKTDYFSVHTPIDHHRHVSRSPMV
ncbi:hypothetical protein BLOT_004133 [Blomia tropicalis]|nr:hypothetical protein BLOT_004133 [Blomia tropicalis]